MMATKAGKPKTMQKNQLAAGGDVKPAGIVKSKAPAEGGAAVSAAPVAAEKASSVPVRATGGEAADSVKARAVSRKTASVKKVPVRRKTAEPVVAEAAGESVAHSGDDIKASPDLFSLFAAVNDGFFRLWTQSTVETVKLAEKAARAGSLNDLCELQIDYACTLGQSCVEEGVRLGDCAFAATQTVGREITVSARQGSPRQG